MPGSVFRRGETVELRTIEEAVLCGKAFVDGERVDMVRYRLLADEWESRP
jgi:RimJ/RimL family protein N-acetyltransferase